MKYGLIGKTLKHSFSQEIYNNYGYSNYQLFELETEDDVCSFIKQRDFQFINVTIPYKQVAFKLCDELDDTAIQTEVVNLIINQNGHLIGYNTDCFGFSTMINQNKVCLENKNILILGTGATSKTINYCLKHFKVKEIRYVSHSIKTDYNYENINDDCLWPNIIINTTPIGMYPNNNESLIDIKLFKNVDTVIDVIYNPLRTKLLLDAKNNGIMICNGLEMLYFQAIKNIEIISGNIISDNELHYLKNKENIILIGMPACGKSTIGLVLANKLQKDFIDVDKEIEKYIGQSISDYFINHSEEEFRDIESSIIEKVSQNANSIIACGGGVVLRKENIDLLKQNGVIVFIDRKLELLELSNNRPLAKSKNDLIKLYNDRYSLYLQYAEYVVQNNDDLESCALEIIKKVC